MGQICRHCKEQDQTNGCRNEGHEGHESEEGEQDRQGKACQGCSLPWNKGEDIWWLEQGRTSQEQAWKDRLQGLCSRRQEGLQQDQEVDGGMPKGKEGTEHQGLLPHWW